MSTSRPDFPDRHSLIRIALKALLLFIALNVAFAALDPVPAIGRLSVYNSLVPGRQRLPFGENPESYNLSLLQLDAMFASHEAAIPPASDEVRVLVVGDSSVWGILLQPNQTLASAITRQGYTTSDGRHVRAYNLGYPTISVTKDLLVMSRAMAFQPDLILWVVTLEAMPRSKQISSPLVQYNPDEVRALIDTYGLDLDPADPNFVDPALQDRTLVGQRRVLADILRLNLYGIMWAGTGVDQIYPEYTPRQNDLENSTDFYGLADPLTEKSLAFDVLEAGHVLAGDVPIVLVNEPMFISDGQNSDIRYNFYYPRWAYDQYRKLMQDQADQHGWQYLDLWDAIDPDEFTNSAIHLTPKGTERLARLIGDSVFKQP